MKQLLFIIPSLCIILCLCSCNSSPEKIKYGFDNCAECNMQIVDKKYGAELVTAKGKVYKFDSIECLANYVNKEKVKDIKSLWVTDFSHPENFINAENAEYIKNDKIHSPMGMNVLALASKNEQDEILNKYGGNSISWTDVLELAKIATY